MRYFKKWAFVPTVFVLIAITYLSLAEDPVHVREIHLFEGADKLVHGCMYLGLVVVGGYDMYRIGLRPSGTSYFLWTVVSVAWGGLMELLQGALTMGRSADWYDFLANACGAFVGFWVCRWVFPRIIGRHESRH